MGKTLEIKNLVECGKGVAENLDNVTRYAQYCVDNIVGFPESCSDEARAQLDEGFLIRHKANRKPVVYGVVDGNLIPLDQLTKEPIEKIEVSVDYALSFSTHEIGRLHETHSPQLKAVVAEWRKRASDYASGCYKALVASAKKLKGEGRTRKPTDEFSVWLFAEKGFFPPAETRCRAAEKRGDPTANHAKFKLAMEAFTKVWKA
jgi:hypothetical protein